MAKQSGLGDNCYVGGFNLSGDIGSIQTIGGSIGTFDVTGIDKSAHERIGGQRDGSIEFTSFFDDAVGASHPVLSALPTTDVVVSYFRGTAIGSPAASMVSKQLNYDGTRSDSGEFTFKVSAQANGFGLEWGQQLTPGIRADSTATNGTSLDTGASLAFGAQAYLHVFATTGTSVTVKLQDSADNSSFADLSGAAFTAATGATAQRIAIGNTATVRRYLRATTTGTFTAATFSVVIVKNAIAGQNF